MPCGVFFYRESPFVTRPLVLLAGGIGFTPLLSILEHILAKEEQSRNIVFIHSVKTLEHLAMKDRIEELAAANENFKAHVFFTQEG